MALLIESDVSLLEPCCGRSEEMVSVFPPPPPPGALLPGALLVVSVPAAVEPGEVVVFLLLPQADTASAAMAMAALVRTNELLRTCSCPSSVDPAADPQALLPLPRKSGGEGRLDALLFRGQY